MKKLNILLISVVCFFSVPVAMAHHSHASLDKDNIQQHTGIVDKYSWRMPHVFIRVKAPNQRGELVDWNIELLHPPGMIGLGWAKDSFKSGDRITWKGEMDKDPDRYYSGLHWAEKADGTRLYNLKGGKKKTPPPVAPSTDFTGLWVRDARVGFTYTPPEQWPYSEKGKALVASFDEKQNPQIDCQNPGPPKSTLLPYPVKITRPEQNTVVIDYELRKQKRIFNIGKNITPGPPSKIGQSKAWMEGDEMIVETSNFIADRWGSHTGVDSSEQKHLVERFSLIEGGQTLRIQMTLTDPEYFTKPVEIDYYMKKVADRELVPSNCTLESVRLLMEAGYE
jgi:hypothetical protein